MPANETTIPHVPPNLRPISIVRATKLIPGVKIHKFHICKNSSIVIHPYLSINVRWIKNEVDAPPPKDCKLILVQIRKSFQIVGYGVCDFMQPLPVILLERECFPLYIKRRSTGGKATFLEPPHSYSNNRPQRIGQR